MSIATKTGDDGTTGMMFNRRVSKTDARVAAYGACDELNVVMGMARAWNEDPFITERLFEIQKELVVLMGELAVADEDRERYRAQGFHFVEPVMVDRLTGLIALGRKKSGKFYRREDINLLNVLANQGAVAIENARMVQEVIEKERMEEELSIARDLQVSMLPAECPQMAGFQIAAFSLAAREVGGDFYDFIDMGNNRLGLVIGDVTGKSVSGALVVSASTAVPEIKDSGTDCNERDNCCRVKTFLISILAVNQIEIDWQQGHLTNNEVVADQNPPDRSKKGGVSNKPRENVAARICDEFPRLN